MYTIISQVDTQARDSQDARDLQNMYIGIGVVVVLVLLAIFVKPLRKATGLLMVILGVLACLTGFGILVGIPMIFIGGVMLFV
jgi:uncharacterized membrane protein YkgB